MKNYFLIIYTFLAIMFLQLLSPLADAKEFLVNSGHPKIFINSSNTATLRSRAATTHSDLYAWIKNWCDERWNNIDEQKYIPSSHPGMRDTGELKYALIYALGSISGFSYSHPINEYADQAIKIMMYRVDNTTGGYISQDYLQLVATAYDWVYPRLSTAQKQKIIDWFEEGAGDSPTVGEEQMMRNGYRMSATPKCLYPMLAFWGEGYKQSLAEIYLTFVKEDWFNDLNAAFHQAGEDGGHSAGPTYARSFYPAYYHIHQDFYALYTATTETLEDLFGSYSYVKGFSEWLLHVMQPGPPSNAAYMADDMVALHKWGDMNPLAWNMENDDMRSKNLLRLLAHVAMEKGKIDKAGWITWMIDDLLKIKKDTIWELFFNDKSINPGSPSSVNLPTVKAFGWNENEGVIDSYRDNPKAGVGEIFMRSSWEGIGEVSTNVTYAAFKAPPYYYFGHQHVDSLAFSIFKGEPLALSESGGYWTTYEGGKIDHSLGTGFPHHWYYYERISSNILLIMDPNEKIRQQPDDWYGTDHQFRDGGQRQMYDGTWRWGKVLENSIYDTGGLIRHEDTPDYTYTSADATKAYNSIVDGARHVCREASPKVSLVQRDFIYLKSDSSNNDYFVVFDRIDSTDPTFKKVFLLHTVGEPGFNGSTSQIYGGASGGLWKSENTDSIKFEQTGAKLFMKTLLPLSTTAYKMGEEATTELDQYIDNVTGIEAGGEKIDIKVKSASVFPDSPVVVIDGGYDVIDGDGNLKSDTDFREAFMCEGRNTATNTLTGCIRARRYFKKNYRSKHNAGAEVKQCYQWMYREADTGNWICHPMHYGIPGESYDYPEGFDEYGRWTMRVETKASEIHSNFFHVFHPTTNMSKNSMAETELISAGNHAGALIKDSLNQWVVILSKDENLFNAIKFNASFSAKAKFLIGGLNKGTYEIYKNGSKINSIPTSNQNTIYFETSGGGTFEIKNIGADTDAPKKPAGFTIMQCNILSRAKPWSLSPGAEGNLPAYNSGSSILRGISSETTFPSGSFRKH